MTKTVKESRLESQSKLSNNTLSQQDLLKVIQVKIQSL
jgi:hypothetical protein